MMKHSFLSVLLSCCLFGISALLLGAPVISGATSDGRLFYKKGETAVFFLRLEGLETSKPKPVKWVWKLKRDYEQPLEGTADYVHGKPLILNISLPHAGFVHISARLVMADGSVMRIPKQKEYSGGLGFSMEECRANPAPEDFDEFWADQLKKLEKVPMKPIIKEVPSNIKGSRCYAVEVPCLGPRPVTGYLVIPEGAKKGSLPAMAVFHGYSYKRHTPPKSVAEQQLITFNINAHGMKLDMTPEEFAATQPAFKDYAFSKTENSNRETAYFYGMTLRVARALQFIKTLPEWNGKELIVNGGSQGGLQSIWAASLDKDVTLCQILIPWCCDLGGISKGRYSGKWRIPYVPALDYFDAAIHAKRIKARVEVSRAGMGDHECPPSGIAAFYNNLSCKAKIRWEQGSTHGYVPPSQYRQYQDFCREADNGKTVQPSKKKVLSPVNKVQGKNELLTPAGTTKAHVLTESYYWMKEKVPPKGDRTEKSGFFREKEWQNDVRLFDGKTTWNSSVSTPFCANRPKHIIVTLDLKENCSLSKIAFSIVNEGKTGNFPATCRLFVSEAGTDASQMQMIRKYTNPYKDIKSAPARYDFEMIPPPGTKGRYVQLVLESKSPMMQVSELKIYGVRLGEEEKNVMPAAWRLEPENIPGFVRDIDVPNMLGKSASVKRQVVNIRVPESAKGKKTFVHVRYCNQGTQDMIILCDGKQTVMPVQPKGKAWSWKKVGETEKSDFTMFFKRTGRRAPGLDSILITTDASFDPNNSSLSQLLKVPVIAHVPGFGETLAKTEPNLSPAEFAEKLAVHYNIPKSAVQKKFSTPEGAILWQGKPIFPVTFYGAAPYDKRLSDMPLNVFIGTHEFNVRTEKYALVPNFHDVWYAYDMLANWVSEMAADNQIIMHYICDEPGNVGVSIKALERMNAVVKRLDPNHPTFVNDVPASAGNKRLMQIADYVGIDHYPVPDGRVFDVGYSVDLARVSSNGRPIIFVAQAFDWAGYRKGNGRWPTPDEISCMTWIPIIHGARGLFYYEFPAPVMGSATCIKDINPKAWERLLELVKNIRAIEPELTGPEAEFPGTYQEKTERNHPVSLRLALSQDKRKAVLIIANGWESKAELTLAWKKQPAEMIPMFVHGVSQKNMTFSMQPFGTAVYRIKADWLADLPVLSREQALQVVQKRLDKNTDRPEADLKLLPKADWSKATDLLDSWKSIRRPNAAKICATPEGLHCKMTIRIPVNAKARITKRDGDVWRDPSIELFLSAADGKSGAHLLLNMNNVQMDGRFSLESSEKYNWKQDYKWTTAVIKGAEIAEFTATIPWSEVKRMTGFSPSEGGTILFNIASTSANLDWAGLSGGSFLVPGKFGILRLPKF
ncbi:MAG: acetylxylan esterase [Lentisphaeria bacterium]|nr:acetylxylan esterase [Lentisphaeria bacterium]